MKKRFPSLGNLFSMPFFKDKRLNSNMNIALLADDNKTELMVQFCIAYCGVLSKHILYAPSSTGKVISNATGLSIITVMPCDQGGDQQIGALIKLNEIDLVFYFCDPSIQKNNKKIDYITRLCDKCNIPIASNIATAEVLIQGLIRGTWTGRITQPPNLVF